MNACLTLRLTACTLLNLKRLINILFIAMLSFSANGEGKKTTAEFEGISVTGSNEQPQVLYIVPWQPPTYQKRAEHPPNIELTGMLKPIEPTFHNEDYYFRKKLEVKVQTLSGSK